LSCSCVACRAVCRSSCRASVAVPMRRLPRACASAAIPCLLVIRRAVRASSRVVRPSGALSCSCVACRAVRRPPFRVFPSSGTPRRASVVSSGHRMRCRAHAPVAVPVRRSPCRASAVIPCFFVIRSVAKDPKPLRLSVGHAAVPCVGRRSARRPPFRAFLSSGAPRRRVPSRAVLSPGVCRAAHRSSCPCVNCRAAHACYFERREGSSLAPPVRRACCHVLFVRCRVLPIALLTLLVRRPHRVACAPPFAAPHAPCAHGVSCCQDTTLSVL